MSYSRNDQSPEEFASRGYHSNGVTDGPRAGDEGKPQADYFTGERTDWGKGGNYRESCENGGYDENAKAYNGKRYGLF